MRMTTTHSFLQEDRHEHHQHEHEQPVNRLPTEVLSWIFVLCAHVCCSGGTKFSVQTNVPAVCRRWRAVALATTNLWARIRLSNRASRARLALFLLRSGPTVPLDIGLEMTEATWTYGEEDPSQNIKLPRDLFAFIIKRGGDLARWQSLCIRADRISSLRGILEFLSSHFFPNLCHFELLLSLNEEESHLEGMKQTYFAGGDPRPLVHSTPQTLHTVKLSAVPYPRLFGHAAHPQFVGLTRLELRFALYVPTFAHTHKLLVASSNELVILRLDSANQARLYPTSEPFLDLNQPPRVTFPKLEALSLSVGTPQWDLGVLQIIDAPNLAVLQIYPGIQSETARADYLCILNLLTYDPDTPPSPPSRPYFPSLIHLSYHCAYVNEDLGRFFDVYELSSLTVPKSLWLDKVHTGLLRCRSVTRLRASFGNFANVKDFLTTIARERYGRGVPLKIVEIANGPADSEIVDELKAWVETVVVRHARVGWEDGDPMNW